MLLSPASRSAACIAASSLEAHTGQAHAEVRREVVEAPPSHTSCSAFLPTSPLRTSCVVRSCRAHVTGQAATTAGASIQSNVTAPPPSNS